MMDTAWEEARLGRVSVMRARCCEGRVEMTLWYFSAGESSWPVVVI
jgi:hypothetical protein